MDMDLKWIEALVEMKPHWEDDETIRSEKFNEANRYVKKCTDGKFRLRMWYNNLIIVQQQHMKWECLYGFIKATPAFCFEISIKIPKEFRIIKEPDKNRMYASYCEATDAVRIYGYTGERRDDTAGYDGYGMEPDKIERIEGYRKADGEWLEPLTSRWD